jgi:hypothetical protein
MPGKKLEPSLYNCNAKRLLDIAEEFLRLAGGDQLKAESFFNEIENLLSWREYPIPDNQPWYWEFADFVLEGKAGETCPFIVWSKGRFRPSPDHADLKHPETWKKPKSGSLGGLTVAESE